MKKRILSFGLTLVFCLGLALPAFAAGQTFADVPTSHWAYAQIERAYAEGVIAGTSYNEQTGVRLFSPDAPLTMAQFAAILCRKFYPDEYAVAVANLDNSWSGAAQVVGVRHGLFGLTDSTNRFPQNISRYKVAEIILKLLGDLCLELPTYAELQAVQSKIGDWEEIPWGFQESVSMTFKLGIISGVNSQGNFAGDNSMTRGQAAVIFCRLSDLVDGLPAESGKYDMTRYTVPADSNKDGFITEEEVLSVLTQIEKEYPDGTHWDENTSYKGVTACAGYALMVSERIFGDLPEHKVTSFADIRVGDALYTERFMKPGHVEIIRDVSDDVYYYTTGGNTGGKVSWNGYGTYAESETILDTRATREQISFNLTSRYPDKRYTDSDRVLDIMVLLPETRCANCNYLMCAAGSRDFDANGGVIHQVCDTCHEFFVCSQCIDCQVYQGHVANCEG